MVFGQDHDVGRLKQKAALGWAAPLQIVSGIRSEFALGQAASVLRGKVARKGKVKGGRETIHRRSW
jgi:hypothetical protein